MIAIHPTPNAVVTRVLPQGIPIVRNEFLNRTGSFGTKLSADRSPGDPGLFGPDSVTWQIVGHPSMMLAGLRAALLQTLSVPIPTATHSTGKFYDDFIGRVGRTGAYVQAQNLGSMDEVYKSARRVRAMHKRVRGTYTDGTRYDATDTHQTAWVSMTLTESFLIMSKRYGRGPLRRAEADAFVRQQSTHAALLDHRIDLDEIFADPDQRAALQSGTLPLPLIEEGELPVTLSELKDRMRAWTSELGTSALTRSLLDNTVALEGAPDNVKRVARPFMLATLHTMPRPWHDLVAPGSNRLAERAAAEAVQYPLLTLSAILGELPAARVARARVAAGESVAAPPHR